MVKAIQKLALMVMALCLMAPITSFAGEWKEDSKGWQYVNDDGHYPTNTWQEIEGKHYYFGADGYMLSNTTTPDGYQVGADGAWITTNHERELDEWPEGHHEKSASADENVDIELMIFKYTEQNLDKWDEWNSRTGLELDADFISLKGWQYTFGHKPYDFINANYNDIDGENIKPETIVFLRMTSDCSTVETLAEFPLLEPYDWVDRGPLEFYTAQGKICFYIEYSYVGSSGLITSNDNVYYQYDILNNQLIKSTKEANRALKISGRYNPSDNLYYEYKDDSLISKNYKNQQVGSVKVNGLDIPETHNDKANVYCQLDKMDGDTAYFTVSVNTPTTMGGIFAGSLSKQYEVRINKNTGALIDYNQK